MKPNAPVAHAKRTRFAATSCQYASSLYVGSRRSGRLLVVGITDFPFMGCDLAGDTVSTTGKGENLAARLLRQMSTPIDGFQSCLNISHVGFRLGVRNLTHLLSPVDCEFQGSGLAAAQQA